MPEASQQVSEPVAKTPEQLLEEINAAIRKAGRKCGKCGWEELWSQTAAHPAGDEQHLVVLKAGGRTSVICTKCQARAEGALKAARTKFMKQAQMHLPGVEG